MNTPARLVAAVGAARLRKLHAALLAAIENGRAVTVRVEAHHGRAFKLTLAVEETL